MQGSSVQLDLLEPKPVPGSLDDQFERWAASDHGIEAIAAFTREAYKIKAAGHAHWGAKKIFEDLRFTSQHPKGSDEHGFKLNNLFTSRVVRLVVERHPELKGFFRLRELRS